MQRFREDSLRILRGVRFAVRYDLTVEEATFRAMGTESHLMDNLARERVFEELCRLLPLVRAEDLQQFAPVLAAVIPELEPLIGFDQRTAHHAYDLFAHVSHVVAGVSSDLVLRWAALLHDIGKIPTFFQDADGNGHFYGHASKGAEMAEAVLRRLKAPTVLRQRVVLLIEKHMMPLVPEKKQLRRQLGKLGWETMEQLLELQEADTVSKGTETREEMEIFQKIRRLLAEIREEDNCLSLKDLAVKGNDLMDLGFSGKEIGDMLRRLLEQVLEENLPNEKECLLAWAEREKD